jgi:hypothetical protein
MENKQAVAVAVGVGAIGTALAYLGYSAYHGSKKERNDNDLYNEVDKEENDKKKDVQLEEAIKEEENMKLAAKRKNSAWGKFWHNSHEDMKKETEKNKDSN